MRVCFADDLYVMISMELQPSVHIQHINHHGIIGSHGLTSQSGQHHSVGLLHHHQQQQQSQAPPHHSMHEDKQQKSELISREQFTHFHKTRFLGIQIGQFIMNVCTIFEVNILHSFSFQVTN